MRALGCRPSIHAVVHRHGRVDPLAVLADHLRLSLGIAVCDNEQRQTMQEQRLRIVMDNGSPWDDQIGIYTAMKV